MLKLWRNQDGGVNVLMPLCILLAVVIAVFVFRDEIREIYDALILALMKKFAPMPPPSVNTIFR